MGSPHIAEAVSIAIETPRSQAIVDGPIAVVVDVIAEIDGPRIHERIPVVAVGCEISAGRDWIAITIRVAHQRLRAAHEGGAPACVTGFRRRAFWGDCGHARPPRSYEFASLDPVAWVAVITIFV